MTLWNVLGEAYSRLGFDTLADEAFKAMVANSEKSFSESVREAEAQQKR